MCDDCICNNEDDYKIIPDRRLSTEDKITWLMIIITVIIFAGFYLILLFGN